MNPDEPSSWSVTVMQSGDLLHYPLWLRAAERIDVPAGGAVPGPLDTAGLPEPSGPTGPELGAAWRQWWTAAVRQAFEPPVEDNAPAPAAGLLGPDFAAVPEPLRHLARRRHPEYRNRARALRPALRELAFEGDVVAEVEARAGAAEPFELVVEFLPVADTVCRRVGPRAFLVPDRLRGTEEYRAWLYGLVRALA